MKLLAAADIHGSQYRLNTILKNIERYHPDLVVICGDITQFGPGPLAKIFLDQIPVETLAIPGNIDPLEVGDSIRESKAYNIDLQKLIKHDVSFIGIGGMVPDFPIFVTDDHVQKPIEDVLDEKSVLVSHVPPYKLQDKVYIGFHAGNKELRDLVETCKPRLVLCGHIHEDPGVTTLGKTVIVNCSMGKRTEGALITLNKKVDVKILN